MTPCPATFRVVLSTTIVLLGLSSAVAAPPAQAPPSQGQESLIRKTIHVSGARAVGIFGDCGEHEPKEECVFTLEAARYSGGLDSDATRFNAVCVDANIVETPLHLSCSPMGRETFAIGADLGVGVDAGILGGGSAVATALAKAGASAGLGFGIELPVRRKLRYPLREPEQIGGSKVSLGGNVLIESDVGSVSAGQTVVFSHRPFTGAVSLIVTRPDFMTMHIGQAGPFGVSCVQPGVLNPVPNAGCFQPFAQALLTACSLNQTGSCANIAQEDEIDDPGAKSVDAQELDDGWRERLEEINAIKDVVRARMLERNLAEVVALLREFEAAGLKEEVRERFRESLSDVRELLATVQQETTFADREASFAELDRLTNLDKKLSAVESSVLGSVNSRTRLLGENHDDICKAHPAQCALRTILP